MRYPLILFIFCLASACQNGSGILKQNYQTLPAKGENGIQVVVEIPAGTSHKIEYDKNQKAFMNDQKDGQDRIINFLPYPGNYGFIPSTYMDPSQGGDGDALDVLVLGESLSTGTVIETKPIATLLLKDQGEIDTKIIAIPSDPNLQIMPMEDFSDFLIHHDAAKRIIEEWFLHYKGAGMMEMVRWEDDQYAMKEIEKWIVQ